MTNILNIDFPTKHPADNKAPGWYYNNNIYTLEYHLEWDGGNVLNLTTAFEFYDQYLVIDGKRIDFTSLHNFIIDHKLNEVKFNDAYKRGTIFELETNLYYLGKNFQEIITDTFYVEK